MNNEWISVKERLPKVSERILIFTGLPYPEHIIIGFLTDTGYFWDEEANYMSLPAIAWMPLPEPPKE